MKLEEYASHDAVGLARLVRAGDVTAVELATLARDAHDRVNPQINAIIEFYDDAETIASGGSGGSDTGLLQGVPFLRKDLGPAEAGRLQERGSRLFEGQRAAVDSYFFQRARQGGLRTLGRTTAPEFGTSGFSDSILHGVTGNPWNTALTSGGSSAGSAAAVAAGIVPLAHGGDGGGSIRTPASWCGLVGLNPSRGRISGGPDRQDTKFGLARNFVLCRTVRDMAAALDILSGPSPGDPFIIVQPDRPYSAELDQPTARLRVGVALTKWGAVECETDVVAAIERTANTLETMGHHVDDIDPPFDAADYGNILLDMSALGASTLGDAAKAMGREIGPDTLEPINLKLYEHSKDLPLAVSARVHEAVRKMRADVGEAVAPFDILLTPTMPTTAPPNGGVYSTTNDTFSAKEWMDADAAFYQYVGVFNVTGQPSVSLPVAQSSGDLPIGVQIVGRFGDEATLVRIARDIEQAMPWANRRPPIHVAAG
ncbi:MAG: amidase [Pseudomonadota bacterium]